MQRPPVATGGHDQIRAVLAIGAVASGQGPDSADTVEAILVILGNPMLDAEKDLSSFQAAAPQVRPKFS